MSDLVSQTYGRVFGGEKNLSFGERALSVALGLGLAAAAARPRPNKMLSALALVAGIGLALRGATGHCAIKAELAEQNRGLIAGR